MDIGNRLIKYRHAIVSVLKLILGLLTTILFIQCVVMYYPATDFHFWGFVMFAVLYLIVLVANANMYHCFEIGMLRKRELIFSWVIAILLTNFIMYFVISLLAKYIVNPLPLLITSGIQMVSGSLLLLLANALFFALRPVRQAVMICSDDQHENDTLSKFQMIRESYRIESVLKESLGYEEIVKAVSDYSTLIVGEIDIDLRKKLINYCFDNNKRMFIFPSVQDIILNNAHLTFVGDSIVYLCRNRTFTPEQLIVKRLIDIVVSVLGLIVASPFMLITAIAIKLQDGGPVFFRQVRYTRNFKTFTLIKFRSMIVNAEENGPQFTTDDDDRITPVGRIIRRTRLDELPQFFNILKGDMSLVGPRAERIENVDYYCEMMPEFRYRMKVKAGLTGYAQIYGKYNTTYEDKLKLDLLYIENASLLQDFQLLFQTVRVLFVPHESTKGFQVKTLNAMDEETRAKMNTEEISGK